MTTCIIEGRDLQCPAAGGAGLRRGVPRTAGLATAAGRTRRRRAAVRHARRSCPRCWPLTPWKPRRQPRRHPPDRHADRAYPSAAAALAGDLGRTGAHWLESQATRPARMAAAGRTLAGITPPGFPFAVPINGGRLTIAAADLTPTGARACPRILLTRRTCSRAVHALRLPEHGVGIPPVSRGSWRTASNATFGSILMCTLS